MYLSLENRALVNALRAEGKHEEANKIVKEWKAPYEDKNENFKPNLKRNDELIAQNINKKGE